MLNLLATAWQTLFEQFDLKTIIIVLLLALFAFVEISKGIDYLSNKRKSKNTEELAQENRFANLESKETENEVAIQKVQCDVKDIKQSVDLLVESDKDDIRAWITDKYHYFMKLGYIDDFTLDCMERRFRSYKQEGGNTYVDGMMDAVRKLPRKNHHEEE